MPMCMTSVAVQLEFVPYNPCASTVRLYIAADKVCTYSVARTEHLALRTASPCQDGATNPKEPVAQLTQQPMYNCKRNAIGIA